VLLSLLVVCIKGRRGKEWWCYFALLVHAVRVRLRDRRYFQYNAVLGVMVLAFIEVNGVCLALPCRFPSDPPFLPFFLTTPLPARRGGRVEG